MGVQLDVGHFFWCEGLSKVHLVTCKHGLPGLLILLFPGRDATCILRSNSTLAADLPGHSLIPLRLLGPWMDLWLDLCLYLVQRGWQPKWKLNLGRVKGVSMALELALGSWDCALEFWGCLLGIWIS